MVRFGFALGGLNRRCPRQFGVDFRLLLGELGAAGRGFGFAFAGAFGRRLPATELQDIGEQLLPFPRRADRESVGTALEQESGVDESFIIQAEQLAQALVGGREVGGADIAVFAPRPLVEAQAAARTGATLPAPQHAVRRAVLLKIQLDVHLRGAVVDQIFLAPRAGFAPEGPGDRIKEGGFAGAVDAAEAGEAQVGQIQGRWGAVGEEITQFETERQHGLGEVLRLC